MVTSYFTLRYIASTLNSILCGSSIQEAFSQEPNEIVFTFASPEIPSLVVSCRPDLSTCYLHPRFARARRNTADVLRGAVGATIQRVSILPADRVIHVELSGNRLVSLQFFGPHSNALLVGPSSLIDDAFRKPSDHRGSEYHADQSGVLLDISRLQSEMTSGGPALSVVRRAFPALGVTLSREVLVRAGIEPDGPLSPGDGDRYHGIVASLQTILNDLQDPAPRLYVTRAGTPAILSIIPLRSAAGYTEKPCVSIHEAIRQMLAHRQSALTLAEERGAVISKLELLIRRARKSLETGAAELRDARRPDSYQEFGNLLLAHASSIARGSRSVDLPGELRPVTIPLDPALTAVGNAERYFDKARRARASRDRLRQRVPLLQARIAECEQFINTLLAAHTPHEFRDMMKSHAALAVAFGVGSTPSEKEKLLFRVFTVDGGFAVWAGKNGANNDLLTFHHARPEDLWFHARGSSGSHVVLKVSTGKGEPGRRAREQAAAIAAYYSRMRTSGTVPVAMTLRKHVRKPKGSPPGTVALEREKVLFVRPRLPEPVSGDVTV